MKQRVTFRFADASDIHYLRQLPEIGDFVTHRNAFWVVASVEMDSLGAVVVCENAVTSQRQPSGKAGGRSGDFGVS
jgi:hypothetical protein